MTSTVSVGQFATMTHLSVKTLRHYHDVGLLEPARVDAGTGYRYYSLDQLPAAQLIRRLRDLKMPIPDVRSVLLARDPDERNVLISAHMDRLETELAETRAAVNSLRVLLDTARTRAPITRRHLPAFTAISIADTIDPGEVATWWEGALAELRAHARDQHLRPTGPAGGIFDEALYQQERAGAMVYLPVSGMTRRQRPDTWRADSRGRTGDHHPLRVDRRHRPRLRRPRQLPRRASSRSRQPDPRALPVRPVRHPDEARWQTEIAWPILTRWPAGLRYALAELR